MPPGEARPWLVCPTAFKGTFSPLQAARRLARPRDAILPLSDGGDGFLECLHAALGGTWRTTPAADPYGLVREAPWLELPDGTACVECARVIGLAGQSRRDPLAASSLGLGQVLQAVAGHRLRPAKGGGASHRARAELVAELVKSVAVP